MAYGTVYRLNFCDDTGESKSLLLQRRNYTGAITDIIGGSSPIIITYKNEEDDKFNPVTSSSASINLIATESFNLNTFYTEDEKEWLVTLLTITGPGHGEYNQEWSGFLIPDTSNEPFLSYPYEFSLRASDLLGTLKDIPYMDGSLLIKKTASILTVLNECLAKTGLELPTLTGVNTYFNTTDATAQVEPLSKVYIDTNRFIDPNNKAFSCYDIIKSLALQFTANLKQSGGKWTFIDISEYKHNSFITRVGGSNIPFTPLIELLPEQIVNKDHNIEKIPAYGAVNSYYQFGFLSNKLLNGDFSVYDEATNKFAGWTQVGANANSVIAAGKEYITLPPPVGEFFTGNYFLRYYNGKDELIPPPIPISARELNMSKYVYSSPVAVTFTSLINFSVSVKSGPNDESMIPIILRLFADGETDRYWNGDTKQWQESPTYIITRIPKSLDYQTISIEANYPPFDGAVEVRIFGGAEKIKYAVPGGTTEKWYAYTTPFDNAIVNISENQFYKSGIGNVSVATNYAGEFSKIPEPIVLLFGDDPNKNRTSWMRDVNGNPTETWFKATQSGVFSTPTRSLQALVSTTVLHHHHKSSRRFEGSFRGYFKALNSFSIPLTNGRFIFLSGEFDIKSATARMVLAEILTDDFDLFDEKQFKDTGSFKDSEGNTVGSPSGVNVPPLPGGGGIPLSTIQDLIDDEFNATDKFIRNQNTLQAGAKLNVYGGNFHNYLSIPAEPPIVGDMIPGLWHDFVDETGTGGDGTAPPVIANLTDLNDVSTTELADGYVLYWHAASGKFRFKVDGGGGGGVSSWNDLTDKPTTLNGYGIQAESDGRYLGIGATAVNSNKWGGESYEGATNTNPSGEVIAFNATTLRWNPTTLNQLGLGSNAFNSTAYLPLTGGTLTGPVTGVDASFSGTVKTGPNLTTAAANFYVGDQISVHAKYGFLDNSIVNYSGVANQAHASFNDNVKYEGIQDADHAHSYQAYPHYNSTGTLKIMAGFWMQPNVTAGTITTLAQFSASNPLGTGAITNLYGLYIPDLTRGTTNYSIWTGSAPSRFGGVVTAPSFTSNVATGTPPFSVTSTTEVANLKASNTSKWENNSFDGIVAPIDTYVIAYHGSNNIGYSNSTNLKNFLGLGSNAYSSIPYLPLTGGILSGNLSGLEASFNKLRLINEGSDDVGAGPSLYLANNGSGSTNYAVSQQLSGIGDLDFWIFNPIISQWAIRAKLTKAGDLNVNGIISAPTFTGALNGNANTADYATNATTATNWAGSGALNNYLLLSGGTLTGPITGPSATFNKIQATDLFSPPSGEPDPLDMIPGRWYDFITE